MLQRDAKQLIERRIDRHGYHLHTRRHDLARVDFTQFEQLLNRVFLEAFEVPFEPAGFNNEFQLFGRMSTADVAAVQSDGPAQ